MPLPQKLDAASKSMAVGVNRLS